MTYQVLKQGGICAFAILCAALWATPALANGCREGASALGNAYVRTNPLYTYYYGTLERYVEQNRAKFTQDAPAIRCSRALARALMNGAITSYDPQALRRQQELNAKLGSMGISPGQQQMTASGQLMLMSQSFARLARVLPPAANGNFGPLRTPTTQFEQLQMFAAQMYAAMMTRDVLEHVRPDVTQAAEAEYDFIVGLARSLAGG